MKARGFGWALVVGAVSLFAASEAMAEPLLGELSESEFGCGSGTYGEVQRWTPQSGNAAAVIADAFLQHGGSLWMGLGYDDTGFWSAEGYSADACDSCDQLFIVHTAWDGKRTSHNVADYDFSDSRFQVEPEAHRKALKARIFTVAANHWPVANMKHDYTLTLPKHDAEGRIEKFTGWFAQVSAPSGSAKTRAPHLLRYAQRGLPHMCWCDYEWVGYALATP